MRPETAQELLQLNAQFYQIFAEDFSATRQRLQPGVMSVVEALPPSANVLDLGCGNGELAAVLESRGHQGSYLGLDISQELLQIAGSRDIPFAEFKQADITTPDWSKDLPAEGFEYIFCFAAMHHIPGADLRDVLVSQIRKLAAPQGRFIHSHWQLTNSVKLRSRVQPWDKIGLQESDVDPGDYLMDWRRGGTGYRYVHQFDNPELRTLAANHHFKIIGLFTSDGESGNLGLYHIWEPAN